MDLSDEQNRRGKRERKVERSFPCEMRVSCAHGFDSTSFLGSSCSCNEEGGGRAIEPLPLISLWQANKSPQLSTKEANWRERVPIILFPPTAPIGLHPLDKKVPTNMSKRRK